MIRCVLCQNALRQLTRSDGYSAFADGSRWYGCTNDDCRHTTVLTKKEIVEGMKKDIVK